MNLRTLSVLMCLGLLVACGQSGPLVLPDKTAPEQVPPASPEPEQEKK